ncbi:MAG: glycosyl transferase [Spirochaetales bacterium]|uniref:Glycosyl transferase n=1 Tax=Candidatus Thalassospirochaeta sargassi TaxID=3119039 RepID=A0AAJ1IEK2_9SPIO|nr:glycosyl transferase [Spirochaetales bacterium]
MKYGYFDDAEKEYVITNPETPSPWINYFGTDGFFSLFSNTGGGYAFYKDALLRRITRYRYNDIPADMNGRCFYLRENGGEYDGEIWSPAWKPVMRKLDSYECRHGMGYTKINSELNGIKTEGVFFVPRGYNCEVHRLKISNNSSSVRSLQLWSFMEFCLWNALDDMTNFQRNLNIGEVEIDGGCVYHKTEYRERRDHYSFYGLNRVPDGFDTDRDSFIGPNRSLSRPVAVEQGNSGNSVADGWYPAASQRVDIDLQPGESTSFIFVLGYVENGDRKWIDGKLNRTGAQEIISAFAADKDVDAALSKLCDFWDDKLSHFSVKTEDDKLDRMLNVWNQYQCMVTYNLSRSASMYESGIGRGIGFRDTNQDLLGIMHMEPAWARVRLIDVASIQLAEGGAFHQYQPLTKRGNDAIGGDFNDDPLWLIIAVAAYVKETGDFSVLDAKVPFADASGNADPSTKDVKMAEHLVRAFHFINENTGPHGLPLIGRADWNDCLNLNCYSTNPDESFQTVVNNDSGTAESVMIAGMLVYAGREYAALCDAAERLVETGVLNGEADYVRAAVDKMSKIILSEGWDGEWFLRAYDAESRKVGSSENDAGRIFIEPQGFCGMAGIGAEEGYTIKALDSVGKHLAHEYGIDIIAPAYQEYDLSKGEITSYPPGYKENGGIFCHNNPWIIIAEAVAGRGEKAFDYYSRIAPAYIEEISDLHRTEPYVYSQMIAGSEAGRSGQAKNSWLTGTAAWNWVAASQWILGIRPSFDGLVIDPCLPPEMKKVEVVRYFRGTRYEIKIDNPDGLSKGEPMTVPFTDGPGRVKVNFRSCRLHNGA